MKRFFAAVVFVVLAFAATGVISAQSDPRIGTWKLDVVKSKFDAAASRKSETRTYESSGGKVMAHVESIGSDGSKQVIGFNGTPDGKDYPYTGEPNGADTISVKRAGSGFNSESKKGGKMLYTTKSAFSNDGKVMTLTTKGTNASGQSINSVRVYDKQ
jgi:hypothetical protein